METVENRLIVFTDAFGPGWVPSAEPFFPFEPLSGGQTRYTARALHWTEENRCKHEEMGFHAGWNQCLDQLIAVASKV